MVPEQGQLLLQRPPGVDHAVDPDGGPGDHGVRIVELEVVPVDHVVVDIGVPLRVEEVLYGDLVAPGGVVLELVPGGAEAGAA